MQSHVKYFRISDKLLECQARSLSCFCISSQDVTVLIINMGVCSGEKSEGNHVNGIIVIINQYIVKIIHKRQQPITKHGCTIPLNSDTEREQRGKCRREGDDMTEKSTFSIPWRKINSGYDGAFSGKNLFFSWQKLLVVSWTRGEFVDFLSLV